MAYAASRRLTLRLNTRADISGDEGSETGMTLLYKFGNLPARKHEHGNPGTNPHSQQDSIGRQHPADGTSAP